MKVLIFIFGACLAVGLSACSIAEEDSDTIGNSIGNKLQEGIQGQGKIVPNDSNPDNANSQFR